MVLATDEVYTYAIFNYALINWSAHTEAGGDTTGGEGGVPAFVSINFHLKFILKQINFKSLILFPNGCTIYKISDWI